MGQLAYRFFVSAFLYWVVATFAGSLLDFPEKIINIATFIPPVLGMMWGPSAAVGVYVGGLFAAPELSKLFATEMNNGDWILYYVRGLWVFLAGYLPCFLWRKWLIDSDENIFSLSLHTLRKFLLIMFVTFLVTSVFRTLTVTAPELKVVTGLFGFGKAETILAYILTCFTNDFFIAIFFDMVAFFFLISRKYPFYTPVKVKKSSRGAQDDESANETYRAWRIALVFYALFPIGVVYICKFQIYGMDNARTWLNFIVECLSVIDIYLVLMLYLMLRYRRSIMLEVVFLTTQTVFLTSTVLGGGSSAAIGNLVNTHTEASLRSMSFICRERLYRTFFSVRQTVDGMKRQAEAGIVSYDRLANDAAYRKDYLNRMKTDFSFGAVGIDGSISYYLRFIPEIEGTKGGFSMQREDTRWEGAVSPFLEREPIDLAPYDPDDAQKVGWYYMPMRSGHSTWIEPYVDAVTDFYVISYVAPLFVEGKFIGVVGMDIDFNFIIHELRRMSIYDYDYVYITNRSNIVLYHSTQPQGAIFKPNPEFQEIEVYLLNGMWLGIATPLTKVYAARNAVLMHLIAAVIIIAMLISIASVTLAAKAIKPLAGMTEAAKRIASGDLNVKISYESGNELGILVRSIREMATRLEYYVYRDRLTGLRNAAAYMSKSKELDEKIKRSPDLNYGVIVFDVNFLKKVNDNYGHEAGNELLRHASQVICRVFVNSPVYRVGGDEFTAVLEEQDYADRQELIDLFDEELAKEHFDAVGDTLNVSVARGLGIYEKGMSFAEVAKRADAAMYNHKAAIKAKYGEEVR